MVTADAEAHAELERGDLDRERQAKLLRDLAAGVPLSQVLDNLVRALEGRTPDMAASVMLVEGGQLRHGAAPGLPEGYNRSADNHPIGEGFGSCGTAVHRRQLVVVEDISQDPLWKNYWEIARRYQLGACWSMPIIGSLDVVLGTLALYHRAAAPTQPGRDHLAPGLCPAGGVRHRIPPHPAGLAAARPGPARAGGGSGGGRLGGGGRDPAGHPCQRPPRAAARVPRRALV